MADATSSSQLTDLGRPTPIACHKCQCMTMWHGTRAPHYVVADPECLNAELQLMSEPLTLYMYIYIYIYIPAQHSAPHHAIAEPACHIDGIGQAQGQVQGCRAALSDHFEQRAQGRCIVGDLGCGCSKAPACTKPRMILCISCAPAPEGLRMIEGRMLRA